MTQQISERVDRALRSDPNDVDGDMTIPDKATRLGKYLKFNDTTGNPEAGSIAGAFTAAGMNHYNFTGDGTTVNFTLGMEPGGENNTQVYIDGVYQQKDGYNVSGAVVQFSVAPPNLSTIEVMVIEVLPVGATTASQVSFTQAGSTYGRNVQLKLQESVSVMDFGAIGDGVTDDTAAIQAADDAVAATGSGIIFFPQGNYLCQSQLNKSPFNTWIGTIGVQDPQTGTHLILGHNGTLVDIDSGGSILYCGNAGIRDMRLLGNMTSYPDGVGINFTAAAGVVRRTYYENLYIYGFDKCVAGILHEQYWNRCFMSAGTYGFFGTNVSDCWIRDTHAGSGLTATGVTGGSGFRFLNVGSLIMDGCRGQVQKGGNGLYLENAVDVRINDHIADGNETIGIQIHNSQGVIISQANVYNNGTISVKQPGIYIQSTGRIFTADSTTNTFTSAAHSYQNTDMKVQVSTTGTLPSGLSANTDYYVIRLGDNTFQLATTRANAIAGTAINISDNGTGVQTLMGIVENIQIIGGESHDKSAGGADEVQSTGIQFASSGSSVMRNIQINNVSLNNVTTPLSGQSAIDTEFRVINCPGVDTVQDDVGDQDIVFAVNSNTNAENTVIFNTPITAKRTVYLTSGGAYEGATFKLIRTANCTGSFDVALSFGGSELAVLSSPGQNTSAVRTSTAWIISDYK